MSRRARFQIPDRDPGRPKVPDALAALAAIPWNERTYSALHVVMEDGNLGDWFVRTMRDLADANGLAPVADFAEMLLRMTPTQRRKVYQRWAPGPWAPSPPPVPIARPPEVLRVDLPGTWP